MADTLNEIKIHISNTGLKVNTENLALNQNSKNNRLYLYAESDFAFVSVYFTRPDDTTYPELHMVPGEWDDDWNSYMFYVDIPFAVTSFTMPNPTAMLKVSFIGYTKNVNDQYIPVSVSDTILTVTRVDNTAVIDYGYTSEEVTGLWNKLGTISTAMEKLQVDEILENQEYQATTINNLNNAVVAVCANVNTIKASVASNADNISAVYAKANSNASDITTLTSTINNLSNTLSNNYYTSNQTDELLAAKVFASSVATINGESILNGGNLEVVTDLSNYYNKTEIDDKITNIDIIETVTTLPTTGSESKIYLVPKTDGKDNDLYDEYIWANSKWEFIKTTVIDLSAYYTSSQVDTKLSSYYTSSQVDTKLASYYTSSQVDNKFNNYYTSAQVNTSLATLESTLKTYSDNQAGKISSISVNGEGLEIDANKNVNIVVPTKTSDLTNDSGYLTNATLSVPTKTSELTNDSDYITASAVSTQVANLKKEILTGDSTEELSTAYDTLIEVAKYIESDVSAGTAINNSIANINTSLQTISAAIPTNVSQLTNDAGYVDASYVASYGGKIDSISVNSTAVDIDTNKNVNIIIPTKVSDLDNDTKFITSTALTDYAKTSDIPTKTSELTNDSNYASTGYVSTAISNLINSSPEALDTLSELASALGNDANFSTTVMNAIGAKANTSDLAAIATSGLFSDLVSHPTTLSGYGITDAYISDGSITLGATTVTPLYEHQSLASYATIAYADSVICKATFKDWSE